MTAIARITSSRDLDRLAAEIRHHVGQTFEHAIRAGELLIEAKAQVRHGEWLPWLKANFPETPQTASTYMRLAEHRDEIEGALSIRGACKQIAAASSEITERDAEQPDRCPRCEHIVRSDQPHKCMQTSRRLSEAHVALRRALIDLRSYPPSTYPRTTSDNEMAATVLHLAGQVQRILSGEPELDEATERRRKSEGVQRTIEGVGKAACKDCGTQLAEDKGRLYCYRCEDPVMAS